MLAYLIIATMSIVVGRSPAAAGPNRTSPAPVVWQTCLGPPTYPRDANILARARRTRRVHSSPDIACCILSVWQVLLGWDRPYHLESDLPYRRSGGCSSGRPPSGGCSSEVPHYPAAPPGVLLWLTNRQLRLLCPMQRVDERESEEAREIFAHLV